PYHTVVPGSGWHDMIETAKGQNIFADVTSSVIEAGEGGSVHSFEIDPEAVLLREPQIIVNRGHSNYKSSSEELREPLVEMTQRPGWDQLPAVQDQQVYSITRFAGGSVSKLIGALYLAKWMHPEAMADVDPGEAFQQWIEEFQGQPMPEPSSHTASLNEGS
ncbi:MAG TPA: ABC transporter substrate-binding protein, partial [Acidimicrobiales bacterium]|nr:ABC transporter substrate-binding protein [Acidimicrobiales bacterium]